MVVVTARKNLVLASDMGVCRWLSRNSPAAKGQDWRCYLPHNITSLLIVARSPVLKRSLSLLTSFCGLFSLRVVVALAGNQGPDRLKDKAALKPLRTWMSLPNTLIRGLLRQSVTKADRLRFEGSQSASLFLLVTNRDLIVVRFCHAKIVNSIQLYLRRPSRLSGAFTIYPLIF